MKKINVVIIVWITLSLKIIDMLTVIEKKSTNILAQTNKYFIAFTDKNNNPYSISNPSAFLSNRAIQRRINQSIPIDITDLPVTPSYVSQIASVSGVTILHRIKWLNGLIIQTTNTVALSVIQSYTFVQSTKALNYTTHHSDIDSVTFNAGYYSNKNYLSTQNYTLNYGNSYNQIHQLNLECLHNAGYKGEGMIIAVIDDGFQNVNNNPVFDSLFQQGRLLGTYDFVSRDTIVFDDDAHGAYVLSTMAALSPGNIVGTAPKASYWLLRSEDISSEYPIEEYYWIRAAEFADSAGVDIINTSLGYSTFDNPTYNHTYTMLDGNTTPIAIAAKIAARKGIFLSIAAGNSGNDPWYYILTPADADSVCTVGAVDVNGNVASFSSHGPTADGRIKPDVCAMGVNTTISSTSGIAFNGNGTSFATPIIAGASACLWQAKPNLTNIQLLNLIKQHSSNVTSPNNNIGWGIPDFCGAFTGIKNIYVNNTIKIFPNPASDNLSVQSSFFIKKITISNLPGDIILEKTINAFSDKINISHLSKGLYIISVQTGNDDLYYEKIMKE